MAMLHLNERETARMRQLEREAQSFRELLNPHISNGNVNMK
jgi:hypothetical protein